MRPQSAKAKGRRLQQIVCQDLLELFPSLEADDIRSTSMGCNGEDISNELKASYATVLSKKSLNF